MVQICCDLQLTVWHCKNLEEKIAIIQNTLPHCIFAKRIATNLNEP